MKELEAIKERAVKAAEARRNFTGESDAETTLLAFIAEQSSYDVPKLIAALEAVGDKAHRLAGSKFSEDQEIADALLQAITEALQ